MKITMGSHLTIAAKLSSDWGPPLIAMSSEARSLIRSVTETGSGPLKRLGLG